MTSRFPEQKARGESRGKTVIYNKSASYYACLLHEGSRGRG